MGDENIRTNQFLTYFSSILTGKIEEKRRHNLSLCNVVLAQRSRHCVKHRHQVKNPKRNEEFQKTRCHHCNSCTVRLKCIEFSIDGNVHFPFATSNIIKPVKTCKNKPWSWILLGERTLVRCQHHCLARIKCSQSELLGNGVISSFKTLQGLYHARLRPNKAQDSLSWQQLVSCQRWKIEQHQVLS